MKRTLIISGSVILILFLCGIGVWRLNKDYMLFWNSNTINVSCENPLANQKVKIGWADENRMSHTKQPGHNRQSSDYDMVFDGHAIKPIGNGYGPNGFFITYGDKFYYSFEQMKLNWHYQHEYDFHFYQKDEKIFIKGNITGEDGMKFDEPMKDIDSLENINGGN